MNLEEADILKKMIDSLVEGKEVEVIEEITETKTEQSALSEEETKKLFRQSVPEDFNWKEAEPVRSPITGDRVFLKFRNEKRWVPDLQTLEKMGFDLSDVKDLTDDEMRIIPEKMGLLTVERW
jgi:hypothetical protein